MKTFKKFINEANIEKLNKDNTFYWSEYNGKLIYQIPQIFPGQSEKVEPIRDIEEEYRQKIENLVLDANNKINREYEKAQEAILKIGENTAKEVNKIISAAKK